MAATSTTETWDAAWTLTMRAKRKRLTDNIFDEYPLLRWLRRRGNVEIETGGKEFQEDLLYGKNSAQWFAGYDALNTDAVDGITAAFFQPRYVSVPITISFTEEQENRKSDSAQRLLAAKSEQSMNTVLDTVNAAGFGAQSGKSMLGLQDLVAAAPTTGTVGGINRANESWWRNQTNASGGNFNNKTGDIYDGLASMSTMFNDCSEGNTKPNHIFTTLTLYGELEQILESASYARYTSRGDGEIDAGTLSFRGAGVDYDRDCASGKMYFLNSRFLKLKILSGVNFAKTPFKEPSNQLAKVGFIVMGGNLTTNNPRRLGQVDFT